MAGEYEGATRLKSANEVLRAARVQAAGGYETYQDLIQQGYDFSAIDAWARDTFNLPDAEVDTAGGLSDEPAEDVGEIVNPSGPVDSVRGTLETPVAGVPLWGWAFGGLALWALASGKV